MGGRLHHPVIQPDHCGRTACRFVGVSGFYLLTGNSRKTSRWQQRTAAWEGGDQFIKQGSKASATFVLHMTLRRMEDFCRMCEVYVITYSKRAFKSQTALCRVHPENWCRDERLYFCFHLVLLGLPHLKKENIKTYVKLFIHFRKDPLSVGLCALTQSQF